MDVVEVLARRFFLAMVEHGLQGAAAIFVRQRRPVLVNAVLLAKSRKSITKPRVPIEYGATRIKSQRLDAVITHAFSPKHVPVIRSNYPVRIVVRLARRCAGRDGD